MLQIAANWLEQEATDMAAAKEAYMEENCPTPDMSVDMAALAVTGLNHRSRIQNLVNVQSNEIFFALTGLLQKTVPGPGQDR